MKICKVEGCNRRAIAKGLCGKHYKQAWIYGKPLKRTQKDQNEIIACGVTAEILLYNQKNQEIARAIIDIEDIEKINGYKWCLSGRSVQTNIDGTSTKIQHILLKKCLIDHKDRNPLNNCKSNLRYCTYSENNSNSAKQKNNTSGFKGVWKSGKGWAAKIMINYKAIYLGSFKDRIEAAKAYNEAAIKYHGEFAHINEI